MNFSGLVLGGSLLLVIGLFHVIVVKVEYYFGTRLWSAFLVLGLLCMVISFAVESDLVSGMLGILGVTLFWSIRELFEQKERVGKGWFPRKPDVQT